MERIKWSSSSGIESLIINLAPIGHKKSVAIVLLYN
jgi:hypothetical protein